MGEAGDGGRGLHSPTYQLNLSPFCSQKPSKRPLLGSTRVVFAFQTSQYGAQNMFTSSRQVDTCSPQKMLTLS